MDTSEETNNPASLFPTAVSEEQLEEARRKITIKQVFGSSKIFTTHSEKCPPRPHLQGSLIIQNKVAEHYTNGQDSMGKYQFEKAVICFSKAITLQPEQTQLYVSQAEAYLQLCDFQSAAACYKQAMLLEPRAFSDRLAFIYYLQGQCLFDRGLFLEAMEAFSKAVEMKSDCRVYQVRSLACLSAVGRLPDCLKLVNDWMASEGPTADLYVLRARLHRQLNEMPRCYQDVKMALELNQACAEAGALLLQLHEASEQARLKAVDRALRGQLIEALCLINVALENSPRDGRLYLFRGILYRRLKDFTAAIEDLVEAIEFVEKEEEEKEKKEKEMEKEKEKVARSQVDVNESTSLPEEAQFQLVLTYNDFAVQCFSRGLYAEATLLLNKAIEQEKGLAGLYLNRGDCFFKQGDWPYAVADYQQAEEMLQAGDPAVCLRLAVVHNTLGLLCFQDGRFQDAAGMFSLAIRYNPGSSQYYENRAKAFRKLLNVEGARLDFICMLILDPTNEEVPPLLMNLFPGCSASNVLSSPKGREVRAQLMETIQACSSSSDPQRLNEKCLKLTEAEKELRLCVNPQDMQMSVKNLIQVEEAVQSFDSDHPTVHRTGHATLTTSQLPPPSTSQPPNTTGGRTVETSKNVMLNPEHALSCNNDPCLRERSKFQM
ncbi:tetratricopeptide repeat protein 16 [Mugil cephalus]|uniref:tetratricopeptide repeat protein 16 n=1 Tax=Mugil cephalus TaxID=48193 RepID=UPI001FB80EF6|nr:tetratricopeptide repeat protein 16 [Mugil cephalus]